MRIMTKYVAAMVLIALTFLGTSATAQEAAARRVADLNPGDVGSFPSNFIAFNGSLYFSAYNFDWGRELWRYDGSAATMVSNINDNTSITEEGLVEGHSSAPTSFGIFNGALYFAAFDERRGGELWRHDGTRAVRVADINPDMNDTIKLFPRSSWPYELTVMNNVLYFGADGGGIFFPNYELWRYDGIRASMVTNIHADFETNHSSYPHGLTVFNNALYFSADDGLNGYELWKYDGTRALLFTNINPGGASSGSFPKRFTPFNGALYFQAFNDLRGFEMWRTDGTNTVLVTDLNPNGSSGADFFTVYKGALYFGADDGTNGFELWRYDGVSARRIADINPFGDSSVKNLTVFGEYLLFAANDGAHGWELWKCDGNSVSLVGDLNPQGDSFPEQLLVWNDHLFFSASNSLSGYEMWMFDGSSARLATDIFPGPPSSFPLWPAGFGSEVLFSANDGYFSDWELWSLRIDPFRIERIEQVGAEVRLTWRTKGGTTNIVQSAESLTGQFHDLSEPLHIDGTSEVSVSYSDVRSNAPGAARFYRIIQP